MANEDSVLREVDQELAEDRQWASIRKYGPTAAIAGVLAIIGVAGWQFYNASQDQAAGELAVEFADASELLIENPSQGREAMKAIADEGGGGYAALAAFRRAASLAGDGEREAAVAALAEIYNDGSVARPLRDLARLRASYMSLKDGRETAMSHLGDLATKEGPYRPYADEVTGIAALKAEDYETALSIFTAISGNPEAPVGVSARAKEFAALALSGKSGVNITGEIRLDDIVGAVSGAEDAAVDDAGEDALDPEEATGAEGAEPHDHDHDGATEETAEESENGTE